MARSWLKSISQTRRQIWTPGFLVVRAGFLLPRKCQIDTPSGELVVGSRDAVTEDDQSECGRILARAALFCRTTASRVFLL